jgi:glutaredoxin
MADANAIKRSAPLPAVLLVALLLGGWPAASEYLRELAATPGHGRRIEAPVVMYATRWCPYCHRAREYFERHSVKYVEHDIEGSPEILAAFHELGGRGVPLILVGDKRMEGFSPRAFDALLE